jgi:alpha-D-xyloside xylohydrolase
MRRSALLSAVLLSSCTHHPDLLLVQPAATVRISSDGRTITLERAQNKQLSFPADGTEIGIVNRLDDQASYDPYWLELKGTAISIDPPKDLRFLRVTSASAVRADAQTVIIQQTYEGGLPARLEVRSEGGDLTNARFSIRLIPMSKLPIAYLRFRARFFGDDGFYGLGDHPDDVNHKGKLRPVQLEPDLAIESADNEAHVPIPLLIGTNGWGVFAKSRRFGLFDVARKEADLVEISYGTAEQSASGLELHLFSAEHPLDVTQSYYEVTGYPLLPATWAYGPWIWRDEFRDQTEVEDDIQKIRDLDLATSAIWLDRPYMSAVNSFDYDPARYFDPTRMIQRAHDAGLRMALWSSPYLAKATGALFDEATEKHYFPPRTGLLLNQWGPPIDLTNSDAYQFWQSLIAQYANMGIEGFKLDYGEDIIGGLSGGRTGWLFHDGSDERTMHYGYTLLYHRVYAEMVPKSGGFLLCRAGRWGDQANVSIVWPGDLDATLTHYRDAFVPRGESGMVMGVGGLSTSLTMALSLGPSGFPFFASDTGGYRHSPPDKETYTRWFEQTAVATAMEVGDASSQPPWEFTAENGRDQATLDLYRQFARLHLRLFPYVWTYAERLSTDGRAIMRPLGLAYPELGAHPSDEYLLGDHLLVAPVLESGATMRPVVFPAGDWIDWFDGTRHMGGSPAPMTVPAPLEKLPLFIAAGGIVPMLRPTIDTLAPAKTSTIESYANDPGIIYVRLTGGPTSSFTMYDGTRIGQSMDAAGLSLSFARGAMFVKGAVFEVIGETQPSAVTLDGAALAHVDSLTALDSATSGWFWSAEIGGTVSIKVPDGTHQLVVR